MNIRKKVVIAIGIILAIIVGIIIANIQAEKSAEEKFEDFAGERLEENHLFVDTAKTNTEFITAEDEKSGEKQRTALRYPRNESPQMKAIREEMTGSIEDSLEGQWHIIDFTWFESELGVISAAAYYEDISINSGEPQVIKRDVNTQVLNSDNYSHIWPLQILNVNYKDRVALYSESYFIGTYQDDILTENWRDYVSDSDANLNRFIVTGSSVVFFFSPGTIAGEDEGVMSITVPTGYLGNAVRDQLLDRYIDPDKPMVAITYDDGPGGAAEERIVEALEKNSSVATFFYQGYRIAKFKDSGYEALEIGCEIGNHSWNHPILTSLGDSEFNRQISKTNNTLKGYYHTDVTLMRPPYGAIDEETAERTGMAVIMWSLDTRDWDFRDADKIFDTIKKPKNLDGHIILMHSLYDETAEATEMLLPWLKEKGYQTVTVSELIRYKTGKDPQPGQIYRKF